MEFSQEEFEDILSIFNEESDEIVHRINNNILSLEKDPENKDIIIELFRDAHSLKGAARMIGFNDIQAIAHKIEDILGLAKEGKILIKSDVTDVLYKAIDFVNLNIQLSVKAKKEVKLNDYGKFMASLEEIVKNTQNKQSVAEGDVSEEAKKDDNKEPSEDPNFLAALKTEVNDVNAKITEITYLLSKTEEKADLNCILALIYDIDFLKNIFQLSLNKELKARLDDILVKLEFVAKNTGILNKIETSELKVKFKDVTARIVNLFNSLNFEVLDYEALSKSKLENRPKNAQEEEKRVYPEFNSKELIENILKLEDSSDIADVILVDIDKLIVLYANTSIEVIFKKVYSILSLIKSQNIRPDGEMVNILRQSIQLVEKLINDTQPADKEDIDLLLQSLDITEQMVGLKKEESLFEAPAKTFQKQLERPEKPLKIQGQDVFQIFESTAIKTLRVDTQKLDKLVNQIGEVIISKIKTQKHILELEEIYNQLVDLYDFSFKAQNYLRYYDRKISQVERDGDTSVFVNFNKQILSFWSESQVKLNDGIQEIYMLHKRMQEDDAKLNLVVNKLEQMVKDIRLLPLATVFHMIPRMVRDIAKDSGKEVDLTIAGSETSVDKKIIEEIKTPLVHIIRNAIDHGIETPHERIGLGKEPSGKITLSARHSDNKIIIEITDDGRGVNLEKIRQKAITNELLTFDEINSMTDEQIMNLIFWPGFTTEDTVTDISGRGIGLDIVQTKISRLNGKVKVQSVVSKGTKVIIELPVTMATIKSFIIRINSQSFAIPVSSIKSVTKVSTSDIYTKDGKENILYHQTSVPIFNLASVLGFEAKPNNRDKKTILMIEAENNVIGFVVEELVGDQEILNKELAPPLFKIKNISGITTLVNGEICLIINVSEVLKTIMSGEYKQFNPQPVTKNELEFNYVPADYSVLIIDDFMTTRIMLKNILSAKGYNVDVANDAIEGLDKVGYKNYNIIISDIEMPKMNGYEFVKTIRGSELKSKIPVILISSLSDKKNKEAAKEAGADLFIEKNEFDQAYFLRSVEYLIRKGQVNGNV